MKRLFVGSFLLLCFLKPASLLAQEETDITGIWNGHIELLDSANQFVQLPFEIAVSEEKGKLGGYSRIIFRANGRDEAGMQEIKIQRKGKEFIIEDEGFLEHDFSINPSKRVKKTMIVKLEITDTEMIMEGKWSTNRTRSYIQMKGDVILKRKVEFKSTAIFKRLDTLKLVEKLSFKDRSETAPVIAVKTPPVEAKPAVVVVAPPPPPMPAPETVPDPDLEIPAIAKPTFVLQSVIKKSQPSTAKVAPPSPQKRSLYNAISKTALKMPKEIESEAEPVVAAVPKPKPAQVVAVPKSEPVASRPVAPAKPVATPTPTPPPPPPKPVPATLVLAPSVTQGAAEIEKRTTKSDQMFYFEQDSLVLTLYDNGEVDGDTVTVLMNGGIIFSKQGLSTKANTKTVYIPAKADSVNLVMYAESLGEIPPNTGLMIIMDGDKRYEVRFSADLKSNAGIILRRRKNR